MTDEEQTRWAPTECARELEGCRLQRLDLIALLARLTQWPAFCGDADAGEGRAARVVLLRTPEGPLAWEVPPEDLARFGALHPLLDADRPLVAEALRLASERTARIVERVDQIVARALAQRAKDAGSGGVDGD